MAQAASSLEAAVAAYASDACHHPRHTTGLQLQHRVGRCGPIVASSPPGLFAAVSPANSLDEAARPLLGACLLSLRLKGIGPSAGRSGDDIPCGSWRPLADVVVCCRALRDVAGGEGSHPVLQRRGRARPTDPVSLDI